MPLDFVFACEQIELRDQKLAFWSSKICDAKSCILTNSSAEVGDPLRNVVTILQYYATVERVRATGDACHVPKVPQAFLNGLRRIASYYLVRFSNNNRPRGF